LISHTSPNRTLAVGDFGDRATAAVPNVFMVSIVPFLIRVPNLAISSLLIFFPCQFEKQLTTGFAQRISKIIKKARIDLHHRSLFTDDFITVSPLDKGIGNFIKIIKAKAIRPNK
jgi:hypothetical protein